MVVCDKVITNYVYDVYFNMCDPSFVKQFILTRTRSSGYNKCMDQDLREVMVQMAIYPFLNTRVMKELLRKALPNRKNIDRYMINNVNIHVRKKKIELDSDNIEIDPKYFNTSFITEYRAISNNYSKGKRVCICLPFPHQLTIFLST